MVHDPRVARLGLQQPHQRQTQRRTLKHSKTYSHRDGDHTNRVLFAKPLVGVFHPVDETDPASGEGTQAPSDAAHVRLGRLPEAI
jgi:hypothetical protein